MKIEFTSERRESWLGGWSRDCRVDGVDYQVAVRRGKSVRIAFKPRGKNRGWHWNGTVYSAGECLWQGRVDKSTGVSGLLERAGLSECDCCQKHRVLSRTEAFGIETWACNTCRGAD